MSIFDTPEKYLSNVDRKSGMVKVRIPSGKSSSVLFSCSIFAMYNKVNCDQKQPPMLKSYLPGINKSIFAKKRCNIFFSKY